MYKLFPQAVKYAENDSFWTALEKYGKGDITKEKMKEVINYRALIGVDYFFHYNVPEENKFAPRGGEERTKISDKLEQKTREELYSVVRDYMDAGD